MNKNLFLMSTVLAMTVAIAAAPVSADVKTFTDVSKENPYYDIIHTMADSKIISGYEDGSFRGNQAITRKHVASLVNRAKGSSLAVKEKAVDFNDVSRKNPNYHDIRVVQQAGIFSPDSKGNFYPNKVVTRAEMAKVLTIAFDLEAKSVKDFSDVPANHPANHYIRAIYSNGITTGNNGKFLPEESLSRVHYAVFMHRAMNLNENAVEQPVPERPTVNAAAIEQQVLDLTNAERVKANLQPLKMHPVLQMTARQKSADMAANKYFDHASPTYGSAFDQMKANGIVYRMAAENIAWGQLSAEEVMESWMNSFGHRDSILTADFTYIGIGYDPNGHYWTQQFLQER